MRAAISLLATLLLAGCGSADPVGASSSGVSSGVSPGAVVSASAHASSSSKPSWGPFPKAARRDSAPPDIQKEAAAEGAKAPLFSLPALQGDWSLEEGLSKTKYVVLVFYRGAW